MHCTSLCKINVTCPFVFHVPKVLQASFASTLVPLIFINTFGTFPAELSHTLQPTRQQNGHLRRASFCSNIYWYPINAISIAPSQKLLGTWPNWASANLAGHSRTLFTANQNVFKDLLNGHQAADQVHMKACHYALAQFLVGEIYLHVGRRQYTVQLHHLSLCLSARLRFAIWRDRIKVNN